MGETHGDHTGHCSTRVLPQHLCLPGIFMTHQEQAKVTARLLGKTSNGVFLFYHSDLRVR
jgi:hypothetical protein